MVISYTYTNYDGAIMIDCDMDLSRNWKAYEFGYFVSTGGDW